MDPDRIKEPLNHSPTTSPATAACWDTVTVTVTDITTALSTLPSLVLLLVSPWSQPGRKEYWDKPEGLLGLFLWELCNEPCFPDLVLFLL